ncbi:hypothetical protein Esi_0086_0038 [Ectocarpus siliculosus]|uniref:Uncharacterized protein n=1 Tax=Ectocarpus siliculosus TaxID=2880 RepID=D7G7Y7_ECTSI|nr:hypothetical protein Esi_0086_0038 [Ectocarpus siliculosus]|eukprot:CBJ27862.1 hypothetical protein Esi_0086_0038 [Ectocarpus siliculosus]
MSLAQAARCTTSADGSVIFATSISTSPRDKVGQATGPIPKERRTLLAVNERLTGKVQVMRSEIFAESEEKKALCEGRGLHKSKVATVVGLLPSGKHSFLHGRAREHPEAHLGS